MSFQVKQLAWHETLELHELTAFQTNGLITLKKALRNIKDQELQNLYQVSIRAIEGNLRDLLKFYPLAPMSAAPVQRQDTGYFAGNLLGLAKTTVRNYAIAITETATPELHKVFEKHLSNAIKLHYQVYQFMYRKGYYPSYELPVLLNNDIQNAQKALQM